MEGAQPGNSQPATLGDVLYAGGAKAPESESHWIALIERIASGDELALHAVYERSHRMVFTLVLRIAGHRETAEELTLDVFEDVWQRAAGHDVGNGTVLGWIMNKARSRALDHMRMEQRRKRAIPTLGNAPEDLVSPAVSLQERLARRIAAERAQEPLPPPPRQWQEPEWDEVSPGISCKLLAADGETHVVSMLVRLLPNVDYPPHRHAGVEELHLLHGELWIDDRKLQAGDYYWAKPGSSDRRVCSETGCTCVLITSTKDALG